MAAGVGLTTCLIGLVLGYVALKVTDVRMGYQLEDLRALRSDLRELNRQLKLELDSLKSLALIEEKARGEMGFRLPDTDQVLNAREFVGEEGGHGSLRTAWEERVGPTGPRVP
jgi:hypothetical protein